MQDAVVFHRQRCQVCIGHKVADGIASSKHLLKDRPVLVGGLEEPDAGLTQPALRPCDSLIQCERALMQPGVGADADKGREDGPR